MAYAAACSCNPPCGPAIHRQVGFCEPYWPELALLQVDISLDSPQPTVLHWAVNDWNLAPEQHWPAGTKQVVYCHGMPFSICIASIHS